MRKTENNRRSPMPMGVFMMRMAAVLFCLVIISVYLTSGLYARYTASGSGKDSARVAAFDVKITGPVGVECAVTALHPGEITLTVDNDSEVAVSYNFRIRIEEQVGCGVLVILDKDNQKQLKFPAKENTELVYAEVGNLAAGAEPATHTLSFEPLDWAKITKEVTGESKLLSQAFTVYVDVVQID